MEIFENILSFKRSQNYITIKFLGFVYKHLRKGRMQILNDQKLLSPKLFPIHLSKIEKDYFIQQISNIENYLEFGSGGSTFLALLTPGIKKIVSVESDPQWISYLEEWNLIQNSKGKKLKFEYINIGKVTDWGVPTEENKKYLYPNYSTNVFKTNENNYDLVFIDGRFRVACVVQTILNCSQNTKILIHDYNNRPEYHCILEFLDIISTMDTMCLFKIKSNINIEKLNATYEKYKYINN